MDETKWDVNDTGNENIKVRRKTEPTTAEDRDSGICSSAISGAAQASGQTAAQIAAQTAARDAAPAAETPAHIRTERFAGSLTDMELTHLSTCRFCREALADYVEARELLPAPPGFKSSVLDRSRKLEVRLIAGSNQASKKMQLFFFGLRVGAAVLCSLTLLFIAPGFSTRLVSQTYRAETRIERTADRQWTLYDKVDNFTKQLNRLPFMNREVSEHDKKER